MENASPDQAIAEAHFRCIDAFEALLDDVRAQAAGWRLPEQGIHDVYDKYRLWAGNLGAMHSGQNWKQSLDYRLREASFYKVQVMAIVSYS
jgi:hypothetical protein